MWVIGRDKEFPVAHIVIDEPLSVQEVIQLVKKENTSKTHWTLHDGMPGRYFVRVENGEPLFVIFSGMDTQEWGDYIIDFSLIPKKYAPQYQYK